MTAPTEAVLAAAERAGCPATKNGTGYMLRCPAHGDKSASLSLSTGDDGRALLKCFGLGLIRFCGQVG